LHDYFWHPRQKNSVSSITITVLSLLYFSVASCNPQYTERCFILQELAEA